MTCTHHCLGKLNLMVYNIKSIVKNYVSCVKVIIDNANSDTIYIEIAYVYSITLLNFMHANRQTDRQLLSLHSVYTDMCMI